MSDQATEPHAPSTGAEVMRVPWGMFEVARVLFIGYLAFPLIVVSLLMIFFPLLSEPDRFMMEQLIPMAGWVAIFAVLMRRYPVALTRAFGLDQKHPVRFYLRETIKIIVMMLLLMVAVNLIATQLLGAKPQNPYRTFSQAEARMLSLFAVITAPLLEELIFRGFLQSTFRKHMSAVWTIALTALVFMLFHNLYFREPLAMAYVLTLGLILSWFREKNGSVVPGMGGHLFNNLLASGGILFPSSW